MQQSTTVVSTPELSVIIPTLNEAESLPRLLELLRKQQNLVLEVIVADGGSLDGTAEATTEAGARLIQSATGRGRQMNSAAKSASAPYLLFLHADCLPTGDLQMHDALLALKAASGRIGSHRVAGHFRLKFDRSHRGNSLSYRYYESKSALNRAECTNGDQGFLMPTRLFNELGGFDESLWFLEDQRLAEKIRGIGTWITLPGALEASARRFEREGLARRMILSALIMNFERIGLSEFFLRAKSVYRNQESTGYLLMTPIFQLISDLNREAGPKVSRQRWYATGSYVLSNAWQPFFFLDVVLGTWLSNGRHPFLALHDRLFQPVFRYRPFVFLTAGLTWIWFQLSWRIFSLLERRSKRR